MTHTYKITGMTCTGCQAKVQNLLSRIGGVTNVITDLDKGEATITMSQHIPMDELKNALKDHPRYQLHEKEIPKQISAPLNFDEEQKGWLETYKPILLIFAYIIGVTVVVQLWTGAFDWMSWMNHFMAGFFLVFSFFKLLNLKGFAESYAMYDIVAKRIPAWGYVYAFTELFLGLGYLSNFQPVIINTVTLVVMSVSIVGVLQSVLDKKKIKCACLGDVFNLPMSTVTITEDALMIVMSGVMLVYLL